MTSMAAAVSVLAVGCSTGPDSEAAQHVATRFVTAVSDDDGDLACALLSTAAAEEVAKSEGKPCPVAIGSMNLPTSTAMTGSETYMRSAQVRSANDVLFLAQFDGQWRVVAAGCTKQPGHPYSCLIQAG
jgi:hypothetical protein